MRTIRTPATSTARALGRLFVLSLMVTATAACTDWTTFHGGPDRAGFQRFETQLSVDTVASLSESHRFPDAYVPPVIVNGVLYTLGSKLSAFDVAHGSGCAGTPSTCAPLWTADAPNSAALTVADGTVFVVSNQGAGLRAYDAAGVNGCSGSPRVCQPLWTSVGFAVGPGSPVVVNDTLYVTGIGIGIGNGGPLIFAFGARGLTNCGGTPRTCTPLWTTVAPAVTNGLAYGTVAVANGIAYIAADNTLYAFDATASTCAGAPKICAPLWNASVPGSQSGQVYSTPSVGDGAVFIGGTLNGTLYAFDAAGTRNCSGVPKTCLPLWTASTSAVISSSAAVANGVVYLVSTNGSLAAYDASGETNCSGNPKSCLPLWRTAVLSNGGQVATSSPAVANGVVYFVTTDGSTYSLDAVDASGVKNCAGTPRICTPLWSTTPGGSTWGSPAVVHGSLYVDNWFDRTVRAYALASTS